MLVEPPTAVCPRGAGGLLILNHNNPMSISEMEKSLKKAWATVIYLKSYTNETISSMLNVSNEYFISQVD